MSRRSHLSLRIGALALLACAAIWPRARGGVTAVELSRSVAATRTPAARAETTAAKLASAPHTAKLVVASSDTHLSN